jgi:hypothetical protein
MKMHTNSAGKQRYDDGKMFWAWDDETLEENEFILEMEEGFEVDDLGLYIITDLSKVVWIEENNNGDEGVE